MATSSTIHIGIFAYPGAQNAAVYGLLDLFQTAEKFNRETGHANGHSPLKIEVLTELCAQNSAHLSALILPPSLHGDILAKANEHKADLERLYSGGVLMCSVCAGAFLLAEAGLLDGRIATTHWDLAGQFETCYPQVELNVERMLVDDGDLITAGGVMAWIDLGLKLVDRFLGPAIMLKTAKFLLVDPGEREQRFYSVFSPSLSHGDSAVLKVQQWLQAHFSEAVTVKAMAEISGLTGRTFIRRFQQATGFSPSEYLQHLRIGKARELMELSNQSVDQIAWQVGYQDPGAFRRIFQKVMGLTPRDYRARFAVSHADR